MRDDDDGIDPIGCAFGFVIIAGLAICVLAVLIKFGIHALKWAIR